MSSFTRSAKFEQCEMSRYEVILEALTLKEKTEVLICAV